MNIKKPNIELYTNGGPEILDLEEALDVPAYTIWGDTLPNARDSWALYNQVLDDAFNDRNDVPPGLLERMRPHPASGCWVWHGYLDWANYGHFSQPGKDYSHTVHRMLYQLLYGIEESSDGDLDHLCRNRRCCNPMHLDKTDASTNMLRIPDKASEQRLSENPKFGFLASAYGIEEPSVIVHKKGISYIDTESAEVRFEPWDKWSGPYKLRAMKVGGKKGRHTKMVRASTLPTYALGVDRILPSAFESLQLYLSQMKADTLFDVPRVSQSVMEHLHLDTITGCWEADTHVNYRGYATISSPPGESGLVHKFMHERFSGQMEPGQQTDHLCRNTICGNPLHLETVSAAENQRRRRNAKKHEDKLFHGQLLMRPLWDEQQAPNGEIIVLTAHGLVFGKDRLAQ